MSGRVLLSFACSPADEDAVAAALRDGTDAPLHLRDERVLARDYAGAHVAEQVSGLLERRVIALVVEAPDAEPLVARAIGARRRHPLRWWSTAVLAEGRAP